MEWQHALITLTEYARKMPDKSFGTIQLGQQRVTFFWRHFTVRQHNALMSVIGYADRYTARIAVEFAGEGLSYWDIFTEIVYKGLTIRFATYGEADEIMRLGLPGVGSVAHRTDPKQRRIMIDPVLFKAKLDAAAVTA